MNERVTVLIIASAGQVRDGLRALLRAMRGVEVVDRPCDGGLNADLLAEQDLALILIDCNLVDPAALDALRRLKTQHPKLRLLVLVEDVEQERQARETGVVDCVLIKGTSAERLADAVRDLLTHHAKQGGPSDE